MGERATGHSPEPGLAYQELTPDDIIGAVESVGLACDGRLLALNSYENRVYRVGLTDAAPVVVKFYRPGRWTDAAIREEHDFTLELADADIPVATPLARAGDTLHLCGDFRFAVYPCFGGRAPELDDRNLLRQLGRLVARIHRCGEQRDFHHRPALTRARLGDESRDYLLDEGFIPPDLADAYATVCEQALEFVDACFDRCGPHPTLRIHGDFHPGNVLVRDEVVHLVDFDDTCTGPAVQDLWMFLSGDRPEQTPQLAELLGGYTEFRPFDPAELHLVEALRTLRLMHYAAWLARRWDDPAFRIAFPWFNTQRYWDDHVLALKEQLSLMGEQPLDWMEAP
jgi:Ser/Thr protein kinase RdoA (MazF antagonist)